MPLITRNSFSSSFSLVDYLQLKETFEEDVKSKQSEHSSICYQQKSRTMKSNARAASGSVFLILVLHFISHTPAKLPKMHCICSKLLSYKMANSVLPQVSYVRFFVMAFQLASRVSPMFQMSTLMSYWVGLYGSKMHGKILEGVKILISCVHKVIGQQKLSSPPLLLEGPARLHDVGNEASDDEA